MKMYLSSNIDTKRRIKKLLFSLIGVFCVLVIYLLLYLYFPKYTLRCAFHSLTGLNCPGCGISRMLVSFVNLDFANGIKYNIFLGSTFPLLLGIIAYYCYSYVSKKKIKWIEVIAFIYVVLLIIWGIVRNIYGI